jgi:hypothetical protein
VLSVSLLLGFFKIQNNELPVRVAFQALHVVARWHGTISSQNTQKLWNKRTLVRTFVHTVADDVG